MQHAFFLEKYIDGVWCEAEIAASSAVANIKPIPPRPKVEVVYEKVTFDKISDIALSYEKGETLYACNSNQYSEVNVYGAISLHRHGDDLYLRLEKPTDWRDEVCKFLLSRTPYAPQNNLRVGDQFLSEDDFIEMCHIALKASGKI